MKTFEEAVKILNADNVDKIQADSSELWSNLKQEPAFQEIIRMTLDEVLMDMIKMQSPVKAVMKGLIAMAQTFIMIGMEMEKE